MGNIENVIVKRAGATVVVRCPARWKVALGDSIAVQGVCSTVAAIDVGVYSTDAPIKEKCLTFMYMPETLDCTTIRRWKVGMPAHLEQSLRLSDRLDGHMVQGHVDTVGTVAAIKKEGNSMVLTVKPAALGELRYAASKGSVALEGVSLTITSVTTTNFAVKLVPYTWMHTTFRDLKVGHKVNIEWDVVAKYVEQLRKFAV